MTHLIDVKHQTMTEQHIGWITWLTYTCAYMLAAPIVALLSFTFALSSCAYVLFSILYLPVYAALVMRAKAPHDQSIADTQWAVGLFFSVSWIMSVLFYTTLDTSAATPVRTVKTVAAVSTLTVGPLMQRQ